MYPHQCHRLYTLIARKANPVRSAFSLGKFPWLHVADLEGAPAPPCAQILDTTIVCIPCCIRMLNNVHLYPKYFGFVVMRDLIHGGGVEVPICTKHSKKKCSSSNEIKFIKFKKQLGLRELLKRRLQHSMHYFAGYICSTNLDTTYLISSPHHGILPTLKVHCIWTQVYLNSTRYFNMNVGVNELLNF